jgi:hypothetical protein
VIEGREKAVATIANAFDASIAAANVDPKFIRELDTEHDDIYDFFRINDRPNGTNQIELAVLKSKFSRL